MMASKFCKYCKIDSEDKTSYGVDYNGHGQVTQDLINSLVTLDDVWLAYLVKDDDVYYLETNEPGVSNRDVSFTPVKYCPWCGRRLGGE